MNSYEDKCSVHKHDYNTKYCFNKINIEKGYYFTYIDNFKGILSEIKNIKNAEIRLLKNNMYQITILKIVYSLEEELFPVAERLILKDRNVILKININFKHDNLYLCKSDIILGNYYFTINDIDDDNEQKESIRCDVNECHNECVLDCILDHKTEELLKNIS